MVPQMNSSASDTNGNQSKSRREQLIDQCLQIGMPVIGDENEETLEMYIEIANDDEFDDLGLSYENSDDEKVSNVNSKVKSNGILGKLVSLFM